jgi:hypothetical protein
MLQVFAGVGNRAGREVQGVLGVFLQPAVEHDALLAAIRDHFDFAHHDIGTL